MKDEFEFEVSNEGKLVCIYQEGIEKMADAMGFTITNIARASHIEWENGSWVVRSAKDSNFAIRVLESTELQLKMHVSDKGELVTFKSKAEALYWEEQLFWGLLRGGEPNVG